MRQIILDTETTGLDPASGHRIVEIGCVEVVNYIPTGAVYHQYINPLRDMPQGAFEVHGLAQDFLKDFPTFDKIHDAFMDFIGSSPLVIHNADFDMKFLLAESRRLIPDFSYENEIIDTLKIARKKFPGSPASLDALCRRFSVDTTSRTKHGALLDCQLLADVYLELMGGRQQTLFATPQAGGEGPKDTPLVFTPKNFPPRTFVLPPEEAKAHAAFVNQLKNPMWK